MKRLTILIWLALAVAAMGLRAAAQDAPIYELYGGYAFLYLPDGETLPPVHAAHGWTVSFTANVSRSFGIEIEEGAYYNSHFLCDCSSPTSDTIIFRGSGHTLLVGPRVRSQGAHRWDLFAHALVGLNHMPWSGFTDESAATPVFTATPGAKTGTALALGGGIDVPVRHSWAARASFDYMVMQDTLGYGPIPPTNTFRVSAGFVYRFGWRK